MERKLARGRPRQYDPTQALRAVLGEFRRRGYSATSLDHLSEATQMARPSLYSAFGNKLEMYRKAVQQYVDEVADHRKRALFSKPLRKGLESYFQEIVKAYVTPDGEPLGCPVLSVISAEAAGDSSIRAELAAAVTNLDAEFRQCLEMATNRREIPAEADNAGLAAMLAALQHSLAMRARAGESAPNLLMIARSHIALALGAAGYLGIDAPRR